jgi:hypothetical protein
VVHPKKTNGNGAPDKLRPMNGVVVETLVEPDVVIRDVDVQPPGVVAADAIALALRDVGDGPIGVSGPQAAIVAQWLRQRGLHAEVLAAPGKKASREKRGLRTPKLSAIVVMDWLTQATGAGGVLGHIKQALSSQGRLIAVVPNVTHASVRLAVLLGRYPLASTESPVARHAFTAKDVERRLHEAGFTVTSVERQIDSADVLKEVAGDVPEAVIQLLADDADAMTSHFVFVAESDGAASAARLLNRRLGELADEQRAVVFQSARLGDRVADLEVRVRHWTNETERLTGPSMAVRDNVAMLEARVQQLAADHSELAATTGRALTAFEDVDKQICAMTERSVVAATTDAARDAALREAGDRFLTRTDEIAALVQRVERIRYRRLVPRLHRLVAGATPRGATVAVISRGDDELLAFEGRRGWHFPQTDRGVYAGHHPADSAAAIAHVEELRARGARYLVVPRTSFWWLDYYQEFHKHLQRNGGCVVRDDRSGALFELGGRRSQ